MKKPFIILSFVLLSLPLSILSVNKFKHLNGLNDKARMKYICEQYPFAIRFLQQPPQVQTTCEHLDELVDSAISRTSQDLLLRVLGNREKKVKDLPVEKPHLNYKRDLYKTVEQLFPDVEDSIYTNSKIQEEIDFLQELADKVVAEEIETIQKKYNN